MEGKRTSEVCLDMARQSEETALRARDQASKEFHQHMATRWRMIAHSYEYIEKVERFLAAAKGKI